MKDTSTKKSELENFFLVGPLGFEESFQNEIRQIQPWILGSDGRPTPHLFQIEKVRKGGLDIKAPRLEGFQLVHHLKTPVRLLWRWKSKKLSHVAELKSYIRSLRPQEILEKPFGLKINSRKSRLHNEKMIARVFEEDWTFLNEKSDQTLYVDLFEDQLTLSWDLCGEPLYKRSWAPAKGVAPIRENLARLLLEDLVAGLTGPELKKLSLVDPMMGSGTFLWEALAWNKVNIERPFSYQMWKGVPAFLKTHWWAQVNLPSEGLFKDYWGFDQDPSMLKLAAENLRSFKNSEVHLGQQDVLQPLSQNVPGEKLMISNPPYGERLQVHSIAKLIRSSLEAYQPRRALFVFPVGFLPEVKGYAGQVVRPFSQGGIPVQVVLYLRSTPA